MRITHRQITMMVAVLVLALAAACAPAADPTRIVRTVTPSFEPVADAMAQAIQAEMDRHRLPALSIAVVEDGRIV